MVIQVVMENPRLLNYTLKNNLKNARNLVGVEELFKVVSPETMDTNQPSLGLGIKGCDATVPSPKGLLSANIPTVTLAYGISSALHNFSRRGEPIPSHYRVIKDPKELHTLSDKHICFDIEHGGDSNKGTWAKDPMLSIALYDDKGTWLVVPAELCEHPDTIKIMQAKFQQAETLICHNGCFDCGYVSKRWGLTEPVYMTDDTLLMNFTLFNTGKDNGLKAVAMRVVNAPDWDLGQPKKNLERVDPEELYRYNAHDVYYTYQLYLELSKMLQTMPDLHKYYRYRVKIAHMLQDMQANGQYVDRYELENQRIIYQHHTEHYLNLLRQQVDNPGFNPSSPKQVKEVFESWGMPVSSTDEEHMKEVKKTRPDTKFSLFADTLLKFRENKKIVSSYVQTISDTMDENGYVHPSFLPHGTVTGRLAAKRPAIQTMPRAATIKKALTAPPGYVMIGADYSQAELRTVAELSGDEGLIAAFQPGAPDFFDNMLSQVWSDRFDSLEHFQQWKKENPVEANEMRAAIKGVVYGANYGRSPWGIAQGLDIPVEEAESIYNRYMETYPGLAAWQNKVRDAVGDYSKLDVLTTPFGMRFLVEGIHGKYRDKKERECLASVPQSTANDICLNAALAVHSQLGQYGAWISGLVHDAMYIICPEQHAETVCNLVEKEMADAATLVFNRVPFVAEAEVGSSWKEL